MKIKHLIGSAMTIGLLAAGLTACVTEKEEANEGKANKLEAQAKITKDQAQKIALDRVPAARSRRLSLKRRRANCSGRLTLPHPAPKT